MAATEIELTLIAIHDYYVIVKSATVNRFTVKAHVIKSKQREEVNKTSFGSSVTDIEFFIMGDAKEIVDVALKEQEARATLRELFLKAVGELSGKPCNIVTYEKSTLFGTFATWHPDGTEIILRDLETPAHFQISTALLRTPDVIAIEFNIPIELP